MSIKVHLRRVRPGVFGGSLTTSLCGRFRLMADGMNLTDTESAVTCSFCRTRIKARKRREAAVPKA